MADLSGPRVSTTKQLFARSRNQCAFPECTLPIVEADRTGTGVMCHIRGREGGPRYDEKQSAEERHGFDNLILMCRNHHEMIDASPERFTVESLVEMKATHEEEAPPLQGLDESVIEQLSSKIPQSVTVGSGNITADRNVIIVRGGVLALLLFGALQLLDRSPAEKESAWPGRMPTRHDMEEIAKAAREHSAKQNAEAKKAKKSDLEARLKGVWILW